MGVILEIQDPEDISLILLDEVEAVIWRRTPPSALKAAAKAFAPRKVRADQQRRREKGYIDRGRILVGENDPGYKKLLKPFWNERRTLSQAFNKAFGGRTSKTFLMAQAPFRADSVDNNFHRDYSTATAAVFMTAVHVGRGTELIPRRDAGGAKPGEQMRAMHYAPRTLKNMVSANAGDVVIMKSGKKGTVHRSPHKTSKGLRFWTFFQSADVRDLRKKQDMKALRKRYKELAGATPARPRRKSP